MAAYSQYERRSATWMLSWIIPEKGRVQSHSAQEYHFLRRRKASIFLIRNGFNREDTGWEAQEKSACLVGREAVSIQHCLCCSELKEEFKSTVFVEIWRCCYRWRGQCMAVLVWEGKRFLILLVEYEISGAHRWVVYEAPWPSQSKAKQLEVRDAGKTVRRGEI